MAEVSATARYLRISPQKVREVAYLVRGKSPEQALEILRNLPQRPARFLSKVINSALANARQQGLATEKLQLKALLVEKGPVLKRMRCASMGRGMAILHRLSHIKVILTDEWAKK